MVKIKLNKLATCSSVLTLIAALLMVQAVAAQPGDRIFRGGLVPRVAAGVDSAEPPNDELAQNGAALKTDPELQRLVGRSDQFVKEQRYDLAAVLWQKVLDEAGDSLMTQDGRLYISVRSEVEQSLKKLPKLALQTYRISADGEAQAVLSRAPADDAQALGEVVRRYFLSSLGDDAAYKLGCQALDRYDFVSAARMFEKVLFEYPDPSIPRSELLVRYALASARLGDKKTAQLALTELKSVAGPRPAAAVTSYVSRVVEQPTISLGQDRDLGWLTTLGNPQHTGQMPVTDRAVTSRTLSEMWIYDFPMVASAAMPQNPNSGVVVFGADAFGGMGIIRGGRSARDSQQAQASREQLIGQWRSNGWRPTTQLLFDQGKVFCKTSDRLISVRDDLYSDIPAQSAWRNLYELDGMSWTMALYSQNYGMVPRSDDNRPRTPLEVLLFGDRVQSCMSISDGLIFSVEGRLVDESKQVAAAAPQQRQFQWGAVPRRVRQNWLACYEAKSLKSVWHRGASDNEKDNSTDLGFLAAPVPFADLLLVPVTEGGTIWLYALSRTDGKTIWKSYLCDEPVGSASPWSPVSVAVDGSDAYVVCGMGVVIAVDAASGSVHWAVRYPRSTKLSRQGNQYGIPNFPLELNGWSEDTAVVHGRAVLVLASDLDQIVALDRRTGDLLWDTPRTNGSLAADYCVGVSNEGLIVAGKNVIRRYSLTGGKLTWEVMTDDSFGRAAVTADTVYLPVKDSILVLDSATGKEVSQVGVRLTTNDPVGNVYVDGEKVWVTGPGRLIALTNLEQRLATLAKQIEEKNHIAQLNRMRLYAKSEQLPAALDDLYGAYKLVQAKEGEEAAQQLVLESLRELHLPSEHPAETFGVLNRIYLADGVSLVASQSSRRRETIGAALSALKLKKDPAGVDSILTSLPLFDQDYLLALASSVLAESATAQHRESLLAALKTGNARTQTVALAALAKVAPEAAAESLPELLQAKDERLKVAAARVSLNLGNRDALQEFVKLLDSEDAAIRLKSYQSLRYATGQRLPFDLSKPAAGRVEDIKRWQEWVTASAATGELKLPLPETDLPLGRILIAFRNQLVELDENHNERWQQQVNNAFVCQGLPNGNRLYGTFGQRGNQHQVIELNEQGEEVWKSFTLPGGPLGLQRLTNGNTLVACSSANQVVEINSAGDIVWQVQAEGQPMGVERLDNGHTLITLSQQGRVIELDSDKKTVWEARNVHGAASVQRLPNGNTLIAEMYTGRVVEMDSTGKKIVWKKEGLNTPRDARRLPNGNTLIAENNSVQEVDPKGTVVWQRRGSGASCISIY